MTEKAPRLRVERLVIVESRSPLTFIRDIPLHAGLNIVWAEELAPSEGGNEVQRAGHGVGKSTFSLMLRAILGDDGAAVKTMRSHLAEHYGSGGIAAEVLVGSERFAVFRSFGLQSFALRGTTVEGLFAEDSKPDTIDFAEYVATLGERASLQHMATRALPVTGQPLEWSHVLCWLARDQALGLRQFFEWRNDDGTGLRRKVKDPPALTRLVLGLLGEAELQAEATITNINEELAISRNELRREEQRGANTRAIVETQLRTWAGVSSSLRMVSDDLFADSVEKELERKTRFLQSQTEDDRKTLNDLERELIELAADIKTQTPKVELAKGRWEESVALRKNDINSLAEIRQRRDKILQLAGSCQYGGISYSDCDYIRAQRSTISLSAKKEIGVLEESVADLAEREVGLKKNYEAHAKVLDELTTTQTQIFERKKALDKGIEERQRQLGQGDAVRKSLAEWQEHQQSPETEKLRAARENVDKLHDKLASAVGSKISAVQQASSLEQKIGERFAALAHSFGAQGRYISSDEKRPFQMLGADGDAYTVLEILLGDLACAAEGADGNGAHPGLLVFDCPREREMSPQLYDRFLRLVAEVCKGVPSLQVILTTTTPPPGPLRKSPTCVLRLSHASDEHLLLKRRIENLLLRVAPAVREDEEI